VTRADDEARATVNLSTQSVSLDVERRHAAATDDAVATGALIDGTFRIERRLGAGGMGVVYLAHDLRLHRDVALKLQRTDGAAQDERALREAKVMARLSNAHVITVYEVGMHGRQLFIAMEYVDGGTLRGWLAERRRTWREILDVFVKAGRGLAAAHDAGLVHRDFKPDNVLIGGDGRVRVADFGLAGLAAVPLGRGGTAAYMSPEQRDGAELDGRADQYSFCVALREALRSARRVPRWLRACVARGLEEDLARRWESMPALLARLERGRRRRSAVAAAALLLLAVGAAGGAIAFAGRDDPRAVCRGADGKLAGIWDADRKRAIVAAFHAAGGARATAAWADTERTVDAYAGRWVAMHTAACEATRVRHEISEEDFDLRVQCLLVRLQDLRSLTHTFLRADDEVVAGAGAAAAGLPDLGTCLDARTLQARQSLPCNLGGPRNDHCVPRAETLHVTSIARDLTAFVAWPVDGAPGVLSYSAATGIATSMRIADDGTPVESARFAWRPGWTHLVSATGPAGPILVAYDAEGGTAAVAGADTVAGIGGLAEQRLPAGITHIIPLARAGASELLLYHGATGEVEWAHIEGRQIQIRPGPRWRAGWTQIMPFSADQTPRFLAYDTRSGALTYYRVEAGGDTTITHSGSWTEGWTAFLSIIVRGQPHFIGYKAGTGRFAVDQVNANGDDVILLESTRSPGRTHFVAFTLKDHPHCFSYRASTGEAFVDRVDP